MAASCATGVLYTHARKLPLRSLRIYSRAHELYLATSTHLLDGANGVPVSHRAHVTRQTGVRDRVEAGGAVGARAGRLVLGVKDDVLGRLAAARRARGVRGTEERHNHTDAPTVVRVGLGLLRVRVTDRVRIRARPQARHLDRSIGLGLRIGLGLGHDLTRAPLTEWL